MTSSAPDETILDEVARLISSDRIKVYGHPADHFADVALMWSALLDADVTPQQVIQCMAALKLARLKNGYHRDTVADLAGYARVMELEHEEILERQRLVREAQEQADRATIKSSYTPPVPYPERCKEVGCEERRARPGKFCAEHEPPVDCAEPDCEYSAERGDTFCAYHQDPWNRVNPEPEPQATLAPTRGSCSTPRCPRDRLYPWSKCDEHLSDEMRRVDEARR